jgi:ABC-type transport system substrate-binding protein
VLPAHQMHAPGAPSHDPEFKMYEYNPEKAKQLLAEAGYPHGLKINYHPQSGWFEDAPLQGGPVWYAPAGGAVVGSPLPRAL